MPAEGVLEREPLSLSPDHDKYYEVVDGQRVEIAPMGAFAGAAASILAFLLNQHAVPRKLGWAVTEVLFGFGPGKNNRRPDLAFIPREEWKRLVNADEDPPSLSTVPPLAVEFVSPSNTAIEIERKMLEYFDAGVEQVWVVYPIFQRIYVYRSSAEIFALTRDDTLDASPILPGLQIKLSDFFDAVSEE